MINWGLCCKHHYLLNLPTPHRTQSCFIHWSRVVMWIPGRDNCLSQQQPESGTPGWLDSCKTCDKWHARISWSILGLIPQPFFDPKRVWVPLSGADSDPKLTYKSAHPKLCWDTTCRHSAAISQTQLPRSESVYLELVWLETALIDFWLINGQGL